MAELEADPDVTAALSKAEIAALFDLGYHTKHVDTIFARVFGAGLSERASGLPARRRRAHPRPRPRQPARRRLAAAPASTTPTRRTPSGA